MACMWECLLVEVCCQRALIGLMLSPQGFHSSSAAPIEDAQAIQRLRTCTQNAQLGKAPTSLSHTPLALPSRTSRTQMLARLSLRREHCTSPQAIGQGSSICELPIYHISLARVPDVSMQAHRQPGAQAMTARTKPET